MRAAVLVFLDATMWRCLQAYNIHAVKLRTPWQVGAMKDRERRIVPGNNFTSWQRVQAAELTDWAREANVDTLKLKQP